LQAHGEAAHRREGGQGGGDLSVSEWYVPATATCVASDVSMPFDGQIDFRRIRRSHPFFYKIVSNHLHNLVWYKNIFLIGKLKINKEKIMENTYL
jgi:hypothetical protein